MSWLPENDLEVHLPMKKESQQMARAAVLSWDWKEQPDLDELARQLCDLSGGTIHLHQVDTESDQFAIVLATRPLDDATVRDIYRSTWDSGESGVVEVSG